MAGVNKVILVGNLGRDPEYKTTAAGTAICRLNIATTRAYNNKAGERIEETEWHRVSVWGKSADACNKYLSKGSSVFVEGRLQTSSYEQDGVKKWTTEVIANDVQFLGGKGGGGGNRGGDGGGGGGGSTMTGGGAPNPPTGGDDDIPF